jgi:predicted ATPase/DNA-binding SARP family transcriptional activator/Tfp pilus assembly protein PilF
VCAALGPLVVRRDDEDVDLGGPKQRAVLAVLLAAAPEAVSTDELVSEVWGESGPADPLRNLQVHVSALRKALGGADTIIGTPAGYRTTLAPADVEEFERAAGEVAELGRSGQGEAACEAATRALSLWRGPAWQDQLHLRRPAAHAQRLEQLRLDMEEVAARAALELGRHREVLPGLESLVEQHPLHEGLHELRILALHRSGRRSDALEAYAATRARLVEETGLDPGESLQRLHAAILADDPALAVEDADLRARRHLPAPVTELVGRDGEVTAVRADLAAHRLVTLTGPGGIGKTRVALQAAHDAVGDFPDGAWFVDLQAVTEPGNVPQAIADAIGLPAPEDIVSALHTWARDRRALLVLDNFEQVEEAAPIVTDLLAAGSRLRVLVTSRVRLRLYGERVRALDPLGEPESRRLFVERAQDVAPWFDATPERDVDRLCAALDRLPLALELVAARADEVGIDRMLAGLAGATGRAGGRLDLAADGPRDRTPRQQSLRAAIAWSVDLLPPREAAAFGRLGVFAGGFTEDAAREVLGLDDPLALGDVVATLGRANLLVRSYDGADQRWRMLETIREFALEHAGDDLTGAREAHARWCSRLAADAVPGMVSDRRTWLPRLRSEVANLRAALEHLASLATDDGNPEPSAGAAPQDAAVVDIVDAPARVRLLALAADLAPYWYRAAPGSEDVQWLARALDLAPDAPAVLRARAWYGRAVCAAEQGRTSEAIEHGREALALLPPGLDDGWRARALNTVAGLTRDLGRAEEALALTEEALALRRELADPGLTLLIPLLNLGLAATDVGATDRAREVLAEALDIARDDYERALVQGRLVGAALAEGAADEAAALLPDVVTTLRAEDERYRLVECLEQLAALAVLHDQPREAAVLLAAADRAMEEDGAQLVAADVVLRERRTGTALASLSPDERRAARVEGGELDLDTALDRGLTLCGRQGPAIT